MSTDEQAREFLQGNGIDPDEQEPCPFGAPEEAVKELAGLEDGKRLDRIADLVAWAAGRGEIELQRYRKAVVEAELIKPGDWRSLASEAKKRRVAEIRTAVRSDCPYTDENGLLYLATPDGGQMLLARFVPQVVAQVIRDDGAEVTTMIKIRVTRPGGKSVEVEVPAERLPMARRWAAQAIGASAVITPMSRDEAHVATAAQYLGDDKWDTQTTYAHTGWRSDIDGTWRFLTATGALGADGLDTSVSVDLGTDALNLYALPDPDAVDDEAIRSAVRASVALLDVAPLTVTVPLLGAVYRAPLPLLPETSAYVVGPSGSLKSALSATALQHYGRGLDAKHFPANWTFTGNALESLANQLANVLLIVDDYAPQSADDPRRLAVAADRIFRGAANSAGRGRLRPDGTPRPARPPKAQIAATGEDVPPGESLRARLTVATVDAGAIDVGKLTEAQQRGAAGVYALAMAQYVRYLAVILDADASRYTDELREQISELRAELSRAMGGHARVPEAAAGLLTGFRQFLKFAVGVRAYSTDEAEAQMEKVKAALLQVAAEQSAYTRGMSVAEVYLRALGSALAAGVAHLADQTTGRQPDESERWGWEPYPGTGETTYHPKGKCVGWLSSSGDIYLHPDVAYEVARDHAGRAAEPLATTKVTIHKRLKEGGHLASIDEKDERPTVVRRIAGKSRRVLHVRAERITGEGEQ